MAAVEWLLFELDPLRITQKDDAGETAMFHAVKCGELEVVKRLHASGHFPASDTNNHGRTSLFLAVENRECLQYLLRVNVFPLDWVDDQGSTIWDHVDTGSRYAIPHKVLSDLLLYGEPPPRSSIHKTHTKEVEMASSIRTMQQQRAEITISYIHRSSFGEATTAVPLSRVVASLAAPTEDELWALATGGGGSFLGISNGSHVQRL